MTARNMRQAAFTILFWTAVLVFSFALAGIALFLFGGAAAVLFLLGSIAACTWFWTLSLQHEREAVEEFCAPEGAEPRAW